MSMIYCLYNCELKFNDPKWRWTSCFAGALGELPLITVGGDEAPSVTTTKRPPGMNEVPLAFHLNGRMKAVN